MLIRGLKLEEKTKGYLNRHKGVYEVKKLWSFNKPTHDTAFQQDLVILKIV